MSPIQLHEDELSKIVSYTHELETALIEFDTRGFSAEAELPELHRVIERLMELSEQSEDEDFRGLMAMFEKDARDCRKCILQRLGKRN